MKQYYLETNESNCYISIKDVQTSWEDVENGNPYNTVFTVTVVSRLFSGISEFEYDIKEFELFIVKLKDLYDKLQGRAELRDICYGSHIIFEIKSNGKLDVSGEIFGEACEHSLIFRFQTDQTALANMCRSLYNDFIIA